jgi:hypothetical protein
MDAQHDAAPGVIHPDDVYRLDELLNRMHRRNFRHSLLPPRRGPEAP